MTRKLCILNIDSVKFNVYYDLSLTWIMIIFDLDFFIILAFIMTIFDVNDFSLDILSFELQIGFACVLSLVEMLLVFKLFFRRIFYGWGFGREQAGQEK